MALGNSLSAEAANRAGRASAMQRHRSAPQLPARSVFGEWLLRGSSRRLDATFRAPIGPGPGAGPSRDRVGTKWVPSDEPAGVLAAAREPRPIEVIMEACGQGNRTRLSAQVVQPLDAGIP
jgi:hypothetical protein